MPSGARRGCSRAAPARWRRCAGSLEDEPHPIAQVGLRQLAREVLREAGDAGERVADLVRPRPPRAAHRGEPVLVRHLGREELALGEILHQHHHARGLAGGAPGLAHLAAAEREGALAPPSGGAPPAARPRRTTNVRTEAGSAPGRRVQPRSDRVVGAEPAEVLERAVPDDHVPVGPRARTPRAAGPPARGGGNGGRPRARPGRPAAGRGWPRAAPRARGCGSLSGARLPWWTRMLRSTTQRATSGPISPRGCAAAAREAGRAAPAAAPRDHVQVGQRLGELGGGHVLAEQRGQARLELLALDGSSIHGPGAAPRCRPPPPPPRARWRG
jgi:hypothetical protein